MRSVVLGVALTWAVEAGAGALDDVVWAELPEVEDAPDVEGVLAGRLADALDDRRGSDGYALGAALGRAVEAGEADPEVEAAAIALLRWLNDATLVPPPPAPLDPLGVEADRAALEATRTLRVERARDRLRAGAYPEAIALLEPLRGLPDFDVDAPLYEEAVDAWIRHERERVGEQFMASRGRPAAERLQVLFEVRAVLEGLLRAYPESLYAEPLEGNLARVEREIALVHEAHADRG